MSVSSAELWRLFPFDPRAEPGSPHSASFVPRPTGRNRFDLPEDQSRVLYLAESPEHAVAEYLQFFRGRSLKAEQLALWGHGLALTKLLCPFAEGDAIVDLCDPRLMAMHGMPPDRIASRDPLITQPIAQRIWDLGHAGLRWWSSFWGDWHTVVLFVARLQSELDASEPEVLTLASSALRAAADALEIRVN